MLSLHKCGKFVNGEILNAKKEETRSVGYEGI